MNRRTVAVALALLIVASSSEAQTTGATRAIALDTVVGVQDYFDDAGAWKTQLIVDPFGTVEVAPRLQVSVRPLIWRVMMGEWEVVRCPGLDSLRVREGQQMAGGGGQVHLAYRTRDDREPGERERQHHLVAPRLLQLSAGDRWRRSAACTDLVDLPDWRSGRHLGRALGRTRGLHRSGSGRLLPRRGPAVSSERRRGRRLFAAAGHAHRRRRRVGPIG